MATELDCFYAKIDVFMQSGDHPLLSISLAKFFLRSCLPGRKTGNKLLMYVAVNFSVQ